MTRWKQFFDEDKRVESAPPTEFVRSAAAAFAAAGKRTILDVGCGAGRDAFYLADQRFCYAIGCTGRANYLVWSGIFRK